MKGDKAERKEKGGKKEKRAPKDLSLPEEAGSDPQEQSKDAANLEAAYARDLSRYQTFKQDEKKPPMSSSKLSFTPRVVFIAEKNSIALTLAQVLSPGSFETSGHSSKIHNFQATLMNQRCSVGVTAVAGHLFNRDFPEVLNNWTRVDPVSLYDANTVRVPCSPGLNAFLAGVCKGADAVVLCLDNDPEGENISFEVLDVVAAHLRPQPFRQIYRLIFSALTPGELKKAVAKLNSGPDANVSLSVDARQVIDLKLGASFTRFLTLHFKAQFANFRDKTVSYGPCQTPALGLVFAREEAIANFEPQKYFGLSFQACRPGKAQTSATFSIESETPLPKFFTKEAVSEFKDSLPKLGKLVRIKRETATKPRPPGLNSVDLMYAMSKNLGMRSFTAMHAAESLYLSGYLTYPRTESTMYPKDFPFRETLQAVQPYDSQYREFIDQLIARPKLGNHKGTDKGDHPPICPTMKVPKSLSGDEARVYEFVLRNFLESLGDDTEIEKKTYHFEFGSVKMVARSARLLPGSLPPIGQKATKYDSSLEEFGLKVDEEIEICAAKVVDRVTEPPGKMQEFELIKEMEKFHIGTDASMSKHIQTLQDRGFVKFNDKTIEVNDLGRVLVRTLKAVDPDLADANLRRDMEIKLEEISKDGQRYAPVLREYLAYYRRKFLNFVAKSHQVSEAAKDTFKTKDAMVAEEGKAFIQCLKCMKYTRFSHSALKVICTGCGLNFDFPDAMEVKQLEARKCPVDKHTLIQYSVEVGVTKVWVVACVVCMASNQEVKSLESGVIGNCNECGKKTLAAFSKDHKTLFEICEGRTCRKLWKIVEGISSVAFDPASICPCKTRKAKIVFASDAKIFAGETLEAVCVRCDEKMKSLREEIANLGKRRAKKGPRKGKK